MKKLFGVMILAGMPVACGTAVPSAPDLSQVIPSEADGTVVASGRGRTPSPICSQEAIVAMVVSVVQRGSGYAVLHAEPVLSDADPVTIGSGPVCFQPVWSVKPTQPVVVDEPGSPDYTLIAPAGTYTVTATVPGASGSVSVLVK
jgi:hypothetical protein